jgi:hypothetical protein
MSLLGDSVLFQPSAMRVQVDVNPHRQDSLAKSGKPTEPAGR